MCRRQRVCRLPCSTCIPRLPETTTNTLHGHGIECDYRMCDVTCIAAIALGLPLGGELGTGKMSASVGRQSSSSKNRQQKSGKGASPSSSDRKKIPSSQSQIRAEKSPKAVRVAGKKVSLQPPFCHCRVAGCYARVACVYCPVWLTVLACGGWLCRGRLRLQRWLGRAVAPAMRVNTIAAQKVQIARIKTGQKIQTQNRTESDKQ